MVFGTTVPGDPGTLRRARIRRVLGKPAAAVPMKAASIGRETMWDKNQRSMSRIAPPFRPLPRGTTPGRIGRGIRVLCGN
jgi:hypothetical protein